MLRGTGGFREWTAGVLAACQLCGCAGWNQVRHATPAEYISSRSPARVRVALPETTLVLYAPSVAGDSVSGFLERDPPAARVAVPASEIRKLEIRGVNPTARNVVFGGSLVIMGAVVVALILGGGPSRGIR